MLHGTGIFAYMYHRCKPNVGKYTSPIDPSWDWNVLRVWKKRWLVSPIPDRSQIRHGETPGHGWQRCLGRSEFRRCCAKPFCLEDHEKKPSCSGYIGDNATQLCGDYKKNIIRIRPCLGDFRGQ